MMRKGERSGSGLGEALTIGEIVERDFPTHERHDVAGHLQPDPFDVAGLDRLPGGLADPRSSRCVALRKTTRTAPPLDPFSDLHLHTDSNHVLERQPLSTEATAITFGTLRNVPGNKSLPPEMAKHVQGVLRAIIARDFTRADGTTIAERQIGKQLRMSQPQLNAIRNWDPGPDPKKPRPCNVGLGALIALSAYTHQSIDAILGRELPLAVQQRQAQLDAIVAKAEEITRVLAEQSTFYFGPKSKVGKLRDEIQRLALAARQQRAMDERVKHVNTMSGGKRQAG